MSSRRLPRSLIENYREHGIVLFLGAGTSMGCKLPSWEGLLERIYQRLVGHLKGKPTYQSLRAKNSLAVLGGILKRLARSARMPFDRIVREALYRDFPFASQDVRTAPYCDRFLRFVRQHNPTLRAVAAMCAIKTPRGFTRNPRIRAIVNFNLHATLRSYSSTRYGLSSASHGLILRTIERPSAGPRLGRINVYYPHGFLDFDTACIDDLSKEAPDRLVLAEGDYFDFFNRPTELFTYTLLTLLREHTCVFVGMSMQDDNLRRLLHYSFQERLLSYRVEGHDDLKSETRSIRHFALMLRSKNAYVAKWNQQSLTALGVSPVVFDDFAEIPDLFRSVYQSTGEDWNSVW